LHFAIIRFALRIPTFVLSNKTHGKWSTVCLTPQQPGLAVVALRAMGIHLPKSVAVESTSKAECFSAAGVSATPDVTPVREWAMFSVASGGI
jgi:hypothetical protein